MLVSDNSDQYSGKPTKPKAYVNEAAYQFDRIGVLLRKAFSPDLIPFPIIANPGIDSYVQNKFVPKFEPGFVKGGEYVIDSPKCGHFAILDKDGCCPFCGEIITKP